MQQKLYGQRDGGIFGYSHFTGGFPGGQAEYVRVPKGNVNLLPIPDNVPDEKALYLSDILVTSYHTVVDTGVSAGDTVAVWVSSVRGSVQTCANSILLGFGSHWTVRRPMVQDYGC